MMRAWIAVTVLVLAPAAAFAADSWGTNPDGSQYPVSLDARESARLDPDEVGSKAFEAKAKPLESLQIVRMDLVRHYDLEKVHPRLGGTGDELVWVVQMRGRFEAARRPPGMGPIVGEEGYLVIDDEAGVVTEAGFIVDVDEPLKEDPKPIAPKVVSPDEVRRFETLRSPLQE